MSNTGLRDVAGDVHTESSAQKSTAGDTENLPKDILVFQQFGRGQGGRFNFVGYYKLNRLQFLESGSEDLLRMLEQKFTRTNKYGRSRQQQRDPDAWKASLNHRWAVLKLEKDVEATDSLQAPNVSITEKVPDNKGPSKSVNEMLKEMRLSSTNPTTTDDQS